MAALLDHADSDGLLRDHAQQWVAVCFQENTRFQKSRRRCTSSADLESTGDRHGGTRWLESDLDRHASSWTTSRCVEVTQRTVLPAEGESQRGTACDTL